MRTITSFLCWIIVLLTTDVYAQTNTTTSSVDVETYELWSKGNWDELIQVGDKALDRGIDFYYLRYRLGVAFFEKKNYQKAVTHLRAARNMNSSDSSLNEYLYYALLNSGWAYQANFLLSKLPRSVQESTGVQLSNPIKQVYVAYSFETGPSQTVESTVKEVSGGSGYQLLSNGHDLFNIGMEHRVFKNIWLHHSYNFIKKATIRHIVYDTEQISDSELQLYLNQYYLGTTLILGTRWELGAGGHYINLIYDDLVAVSNGGRVVNRLERLTKENFLGFLRAKVNYEGWSLGITSLVGNLGNRTHTQQDLILEVYPRGNLNMYSTTVVSLQDNDIHSGIDNLSLILNQTLGSKIATRTWIEGFFTYGTLENFTQSYGSIVFNDSDVINQRYGVKLYYQISSPLVIRIDYVGAMKASKFVSSAPFVVTTPINYHVSTLTAVLLWNF